MQWTAHAPYVGGALADRLGPFPYTRDIGHIAGRPLGWSSHPDLLLDVHSTSADSARHSPPLARHPALGAYRHITWVRAVASTASVLAALRLQANYCCHRIAYTAARTVASEAGGTSNQPIQTSTSARVPSRASPGPLIATPRHDAQCW